MTANNFPSVLIISVSWGKLFARFLFNHVVFVYCYTVNKKANGWVSITSNPYDKLVKNYMHSIWVTKLYQLGNIIVE